MKTTNICITLTLMLVFTSCSKDDDSIPLLDVISNQITNLHAPQNGGSGNGPPTPISGEFTKFDFSAGSVTISDNDWDIGFRGTSIIVNGGVSLGTTDEPSRTGDGAAYIANGTFTSVTQVNPSLFVQDSSNGYAIPAGSGGGWYTYSGPPTYLITPTPGKILVFRTADGKYAKVEILSYYKDSPPTPDYRFSQGRYYTFNYIYQPNEGVTDF